MANNCFYTMKAVSKDESALKRLVEIMNYKDGEYVIYRCFSADCETIRKEGEFFVYDIDGDVAWSCTNWFEHKEDFGNVNEDCGGHYITLDLLCKKLGIGIELFSEECGCEFQQHFHCNHEGDMIVDDTVDWQEEWEDEDGNEYDEPKVVGGFGDEYCVFGTPNEIYG